MQYTIEVSYRTGDSFSSEDTTDAVGVFDSIEDAKEACKHILEHHKFFTSISGWRITADMAKPLIKKAKKEPWAALSEWDENQLSEFSVAYKDQRLHAFWMGYFEHLHSLKIIPLQEDLTFYPY